MWEVRLHAERGIRGVDLVPVVGEVKKQATTGS